MTLLILFAVSIIAFALIRIAPGNPAMMVLPDGASQEAIKAMEVKLGLDQPMVCSISAISAVCSRGTWEPLSSISSR